MNLFFTGLAAALAKPMCKRADWKGWAITAGWLALMTVVFDNFIVGSGIVAYNPEKISNLKILFAPIEDFGYLVVAVFLIPTIWKLTAKLDKPKGGKK